MQKTGTVFRYFFNFNDENFVQIFGLKLKDEGDWIGTG